MPLLTIEEARAQCRVDGTDSDAELSAMVDASADAAAAYLNRTIYAAQSDLDMELDTVAANMATAGQTYADAVTAAQAMTDVDQQQAAMAVAQSRLNAAQATATRTIHGTVANPSILAAIKLTLGHLFANREDVVVGPSAAAVQLPMGAQALLRPYRRVMMP